MKIMNDTTEDVKNDMKDLQVLLFTKIERTKYVYYGIVTSRLNYFGFVKSKLNYPNVIATSISILI